MLRAMVIAALLASLAPAVAGAATTSSAKPVAKPASDARAVPFIADDYTKAVAEAKARKVPLFIEAWAPW